MQKRTLLLVALATIFLLCEAKYFETRCELVDELRRQGFPEDKMRDWVCLIESESGRNTDKVRGGEREGFLTYGLYQINNEEWCSSSSTPGNACNVTCDQLLLDDITVASTCAKTIYRRRNFYAWDGWKFSCNNKTLPDISNC